jgi:hypothetical protein
MIPAHFKKQALIGISMLCFIIFIAFRSSHPVSGGGYTGAPGDGVCAQCHNGSNNSLQGDLMLENLPATVDEGQTYTLTVRQSNPSLNAFRAGFQMVAMDNSNASVGTYSNLPTNVITKNSSGNTYIGHNAETQFNGATEVSWTFDWTAPSSGSSGSMITFYYVAILGNGANGNSNDRFFIRQSTTSLQGTGMPLSANLIANEDSPCANENGGYAEVEASGGTPPYTFSWSNGEFGTEAFALPVGANDVTVTDDAGAQVVLNVTTGSPPLLELNILNISPAPCNGIDGGSAEVSANGGVGGYSYSWPGGLMGNIQNNLSVGSYTVTVNDANNCEATVNLVIDAVPILSISENSSSNPTCLNGSDGFINIDVEGGTSPFTFTWSNGSSTQNISDLQAGIYSVTVNDDNACMATFSTTLNNGAQIVVTPNGVVDVGCNGDSSGSINILVNGGTPPYSYVWSSGETSPNLPSIPAGIYTVTVTDQGGCTGTETFQINEPSALISQVINRENVTCAGGNDGSASVTASGGISPYNFEWPDGGDGSMLSTGIYDVTVSDANNCTRIQQVIINELSPPIFVGVTVDNETSAGFNDGAASAIVVGGLPPYSYIWSTGDTLPTIENLASGTYTVTVTDSLGCSGMGSGFVSSGACVLTASATVSPNPCFGDSLASISLDIMNTTTENQVLWSTGDTTPTINNLPAGSYSVSISDVNQCFFFLTAIQVEDPDLLTVDIDQIGDLACSDDNTELNFNSNRADGLSSVLWSTGSSADTITIDSAGIYSISIIDTAQCVALDTIVVVNVDSISPLFGLDTIQLYVNEDGGIETDFLSDFIFDNCSIDSFNISFSTELNCSASDTVISGYSFALDVNGNIGRDTFEVFITDTIIPSLICPDTITWFSCDTVQLDLPMASDNCQIEEVLPENNLNGQVLDPGFYTISYLARDPSNNQAECSVVLAVQASLTIELSVEDESCAGANDGSFSIDNVEGGIPPYNLDLSGILVPSNLNPGFYSFSITDSIGCTFTDSVHIAEANAIRLDSFIINDALSNTSMDGSIGISASGGTGELEYQWFDQSGNGLGSNTFITDLEPGTYTLLITDGNDCEERFEFVVGVLTSVTNILRNQVQVYPNPVSNIVFIEYPTNQGIVLEVIDATGKVIFRTEKNISFLHTSEWRSGIYFLRLNNKDNVVVKRIIKI